MPWPLTGRSETDHRSHPRTPFPTASRDVTAPTGLLEVRQWPRQGGQHGGRVDVVEIELKWQDLFDEIAEPVRPNGSPRPWVAECPVAREQKVFVLGDQDP